MDWLTQFLPNLKDSFGVKYMLSPVYLGATVLIVFAIWMARGRPGGFLRYMLPRELYLHPSTMVDIKLAIFSTLFAATGALSALYVVPMVTFAVLERLVALTGHGVAEGSTLTRNLIAAAVLFLTQDFCRYWNHYFHHESRFLWPFHAVHHSAEVMTPITFLRAHPLYSVLQVLLISALVGIAQALILFLLIGQIEFWVVYSGTLAFNVYVFFGGHLRHSHIWLSYGPVLERILISPAQHQIHHSSDPKHFDKNYGEVFAIWDWMFGTLYLPKGPEELNFGIADAQGRLIEQPHPTLWAALVGPFAEVWDEIMKGQSRYSVRYADEAEDAGPKEPDKVVRPARR